VTSRLAAVRLSRRALLHSFALAAGTVALTGPSRLLAADADLPWEPIGFTQGGVPLVMQHLGDAPSRVLIIGGQHGAPETNTIELVQRLTQYFVDNRDQLPPTLMLDILAVANPDGATAGSRQYLSGVDPNRNWGGADWQSDGWDSNGVFRRGLGGSEPFSEQETRALADWMLKTRPVLTVNYHSAGGFILAGRDGPIGDISAAYADASGYARPQPGPGSSPLPYRATGSLNVWARGVGLNTLFIELSTPTAVEFDRNLAGLRAVLPMLG
jgi:hypothetical protein